MPRAGKLLRTVLDTNLFGSGSISKGGLPHRLLVEWRGGEFTLLLTAELRAEIEEVLHHPMIAQRYGLTAAEIADLLFIVDTMAVRATPRRRLPVHARDPKDDHVLAAALGGRADYLVTGESDLLVLDGDPRPGHLRILAPREFLNRLTEHLSEHS